MSETKIVTPVGFIEVIVEVGKEIPKETLQFLRSSVRIIGVNTTFRSNINAVIGEKIAIPVRPGTYRVYSFLGDLLSEQTESTVKSGQVAKIRFFFGKEE